MRNQFDPAVPVPRALLAATALLAVTVQLAATAQPASAAKHVTVAQLQQLLIEAQSKPDADAARERSDLELTERLSTAYLAHLLADTHGSASQGALIILADQSAFLNPPPADIPPNPAPDVTEQRRILALTVTYISKTIHQLPNFLATRVTKRFEDRPQEDVQQETALVSYSYLPLHPIGKSSVPVLYRDGREVIDTGAQKAKNNQEQPQGLVSWGEFGPILGIVLVDASKSQLSWSHWEQSTLGPLAVFSYSVPKEKSQYEVKYCCIPGDGILTHEHQMAGYHGEMAIDPATGAILRLTLQADLKPADLVSEADIMVEYGVVDIGGKDYICPTRSVALSVATTIRSIGQLGYSGGNVLGAKKTYLNDIAFQNYHIYFVVKTVSSNNPVIE